VGRFRIHGGRDGYWGLETRSFRYPEGGRCGVWHRLQGRIEIKNISQVFKMSAGCWWDDGLGEKLGKPWHLGQSGAGDAIPRTCGKRKGDWGGLRRAARSMRNANNRGFGTNLAYRFTHWRSYTSRHENDLPCTRKPVEFCEHRLKSRTRGQVTIMRLNRTPPPGIESPHGGPAMDSRCVWQLACVASFDQGRGKRNDFRTFGCVGRALSVGNRKIVLRAVLPRGFPSA